MIGRSADGASLNLNRVQARLGDHVRKLSSGLRVQNAADDPSGLAVAETLQSLVNGYDAGSASVQEAHNALTVAEGALQTATDIVQRIRSLVVQAGNGIDSDADLAALQAEIGQLTHELDHIAEVTQFNGRLLLDGSLDTSPAQPASIVRVDPLPTATSPGTQQKLASGQYFINTFNPGPQATTGYVAFEVVSYQGATFTLRGVLSGADPSVLGNTQDELAPGFPSGGSGFSSTYPDPTPSNRTDITGSYGPVTAADVGVVNAFAITGARPAGTGQAAAIGVGDVEGDQVTISAPGVSAASLGLANLSVARPSETNFFSVFPAGDNSLTVFSDLLACTNALDTLGNARATLGAQTVRLAETIDQAQVASVNLQASESAIRDVNVGAEATANARDTILARIGTAVIAQINSAQRTVLALFH